MTSFLLLLVLAIGIGIGVLAYRHRPEGSIESGIRSFRREMRALAPPAEQGRLHEAERDEPPPGAGMR